MRVLPTVGIAMWMSGIAACAEQPPPQFAPVAGPVPSAGAVTAVPPAPRGSPPAAFGASAGRNDWSEVVDGLRGRLIATKAADVDGHPQARLELELENVTGSSIALWWDETPPSVLRVSLEDQGGIALPSAGVGGSFGAPPPHWVQLAPGSRRTTVSDAVYEYVPGGRTLIRPMTFQGWEMPSAGHGPLYLGGLFTGVKAPEPGHHAWTGPLKLPRVALP